MERNFFSDNILHTPGLKTNKLIQARVDLFEQRIRIRGCHHPPYYEIEVSDGTCDISSPEKTGKKLREDSYIASFDDKEVTSELCKRFVKLKVKCDCERDEIERLLVEAGYTLKKNVFHCDLFHGSKDCQQLLKRRKDKYVFYDVPIYDKRTEKWTIRKKRN